MTKEKRLERMLWGLPYGYIPKHCKVACWVLYDLERLLKARGIKVYDDLSWPYHILVKNVQRRYISLFCKGFRKTIDIQQLKSDGTADTRYKEESFSTTLGAAKYIVSKLR